MVVTYISNMKNLDFKEFYYLELTVLLRKKTYVIKLSVSNSALHSYLHTVILLENMILISTLHCAYQNLGCGK